MIDETIFKEVSEERRKQRKRWDDSRNNEGNFVSMITNYATRYIMTLTYDTEKWNFRHCMITVAALAFAAIEWYDTKEN